MFRHADVTLTTSVQRLYFNNSTFSRCVHWLDNKVFDIIDARRNYENYPPKSHIFQKICYVSLQDNLSQKDSRPPCYYI